MVRSVEQIERDIAALEQMLASTADEFYSIYSSYLTALGQAVRQQLVLASYHLCTQGYPQQFLGLSFDQRQQLQRSLRQAAKQAQAQLIAQLRRVDDIPRESEPLVSPADLDAWFFSTPGEAAPGSAAPMETPLIATEPSEIEGLAAEASLFPKLGNAEPTAPKAKESSSERLTPERIGRWREGIERAIAQTLRQASREVNHLFQQVGILSKELPEVLLEAASKAEEVTEAVAGTPNLLNLVVETMDEDQSETEPRLGPSVTHIVAIHLRLTEIEFTDSTVGIWRQKLRNLSARLHSLAKEYQKKQRERAIAEAEAAWRTSWFED